MKAIYKTQNIEKIKVLGQGTYGKCYLVNNLANHQLCVLKQIQIGGMSQQQIQQTMKQAKILQALDHPNIIKCVQAYVQNRTLNIFMEFADAGDLSKKIKNAKGSYFSQNQVLNWFTQLCLAIKHVHDRKIIHRDLKSQNIFLTTQNLVKLGDFGIAKPLQMTLEKIKTVVGTPYYMSPQICQNKQYSLKTDIWSLGVILFQMCSLKPPFDANSLPALALKITRGQYGTLPSHYSKDLKKIINDLLQVQPSKRPSINQILKYSLLKCRIDNFLPQGIRQRQFSHTTLHSQNIFQRQDLKKQISKLANQQPQLNSIISPRNNNSGHSNSAQQNKHQLILNSNSNKLHTKQSNSNLKDKNPFDKKKKGQLRKRQISQPISSLKNNQKNLRNDSSMSQLQKKKPNKQKNQLQFFKNKRISDQYENQLSQIKQIRGQCIQLSLKARQKQQQLFQLDKRSMDKKNKQDFSKISNKERLINNWMRQQQQLKQLTQEQQSSSQNDSDTAQQNYTQQRQLTKTLQDILIKYMGQNQLSKRYSQIEQNEGFIIPNFQKTQSNPIQNQKYDGLISLLYGINHIMEIK